jgi:hypothetical protein
MVTELNDAGGERLPLMLCGNEKHFGFIHLWYLPGFPPFRSAKQTAKFGSLAL